MAISSINIQKVSPHCFKHNDRTELKKANTVFEEFTHLNSVNKSAIDAEKEFNLLYTECMKKITGKIRRANKKNCLVEAIVNLNSNHTIDDITLLISKIENITGFKCLQVAIHNDEGQEKDRKLIRKNHHAHITFFTLDLSTGRQMFRRQHLTREKLRQLQDIVAIELNMERGKPVEETKRKRLSHKDYKLFAKNEEQKLAKLIDLNKIIKDIKLELIETKKAKQKDYIKLSNLNEELKIKIRNKELSIKDLESNINHYKESFLNSANELENERYLKSLVEDRNSELENNMLELIPLDKYKKESETNDKLFNLIKDLKKELVTKEESKEINSVPKLFKWIIEKFNKFKLIINELKEKIRLLTIENNNLRLENELIKSNLNVKEKESYSRYNNIK